jgi:uncharacterized protein (TIGR03435 family)
MSFSLLSIRKNLRLSLFCLGTFPLAAQTQPHAFEVATIRPDNTLHNNTDVDTNNGSYVATGLSLSSLIREAFNLQTSDQIRNLPSWAGSAWFDINAKIDPDDVAYLKNARREESQKIYTEMLQSLLFDRFRLKIHHEMRELSTYNLVVSKGGSKLKLSALQTGDSVNMSVHNQELTATAAPLSSLIVFLSGQVHRTTIDKTGLTGYYDMALKWTRDELAGTAAEPSDAPPPLFTAIQDQLGLKLEPSKGPVDTIVIDHIEEPTEN